MQKPRKQLRSRPKRPEGRRGSKGWSGPAPRPTWFPAGDSAHDQMFTVLEGMAKIFEANGADCDKLAKALGDYGTKHQTKLAELKGMMDKYTPEQKKAAEASMKTKMMAVLPKIMGGAMKCQKNPAFLEAMKKLKVHKDGFSRTHWGTLYRSSGYSLILRASTRQQCCNSR